MVIKKVDLLLTANNGNRSVFDSIFSPQVLLAFTEWFKNTESKSVLIGGLALSFYAKPRFTADVDLLFLHQGDAPQQVKGFKKTREHAFTHLDTHVEIELLDSAYLELSTNLVAHIFATAVVNQGIKIASREGLIASKLKRFSRQDQADIEAVFLSKITLDNWPLSSKEQANWSKIRSDLLNED